MQIKSQQVLNYVNNYKTHHENNAIIPLYFKDVRFPLLICPHGGKSVEPVSNLGVNGNICQCINDQREEELDDGNHGGVHHLKDGGGEHLITLSVGYNQARREFHFREKEVNLRNY